MKFNIHQPLSLNEVGKRENNEDSVFPQKGMADLNDRLFIVCDGVGGIDKGEVASSLVCRTLSAFIPGNIPTPATKEFFLKAFDEALSAIDLYLSNSADSAGMATTLTLLSLNESGATIMWCGDSRVYQIRKGEIIFKTEDHSFVAELVRGGIISEEQAATHPKKNVITRAIQGHSARNVQPDIFHQTDVRSGDIFFLCTDGILESVSDKTLQSFFSNSSNLIDGVNEIYDLCQNNSRDNFSCYAIGIEAVKGKASEMAGVADEIYLKATVIDEPKKKSKISGILSKQKTGIKIISLVALLGIIFSLYYFVISPKKSKGTETLQKAKTEEVVNASATKPDTTKASDRKQDSTEKASENINPETIKKTEKNSATEK